MVVKVTFSAFEWDEGNQHKNLLKHGVTCQEIEAAFKGNPLVYPDHRHSTPSEARYIAFAEAAPGRCLFVAFTVRKNAMRVISARAMSKKERKWYEEEKRKSNF